MFHYVSLSLECDYNSTKVLAREMRPSLASKQHLHYNNLVRYGHRGVNLSRQPSCGKMVAIILSSIRQQRHLKEACRTLTELFHSSRFAHVPSLSIHWPRQARSRCPSSHTRFQCTCEGHYQRPGSFAGFYLQGSPDQANVRELGNQVRGKPWDHATSCRRTG